MLSHQAVRKAIARGRISARREGRRVFIAVEAADAQWRATTNAALQRGAQAAAPASDRAGRIFASARAEKEFYRAKLAQLEHGERTGALIRADEMQAAAFNLSRDARDMLMGIPSRVATSITGKSQEEIHAILTEEFRRVIRMFTPSDDLSVPAAP